MAGKRPASGGYAHLSADGNTLTLNGFQLTNIDTGVMNGIVIQGDVTLNLVGSSEVFGSTLDTGLYVPSGSLTVQSAGGGSLKATAISRGVILDDGKLTVNSGTLHGISTSSSVGTGIGVEVYGQGISVTGGKLAGDALDSISRGIYSIFCDIEISSGEITGAAGADGWGIAANTLTVKGGTALFTAVDGGNARAVFLSFPGGNGVPDLAGYTAPHTVTVSLNTSGQPTETYDPAQIATYKYLRIVPETPPAPEAPDDDAERGTLQPLAVAVPHPDIYAAPGESARMQVEATGSAGPFHFQ